MGRVLDSLEVPWELVTERTGSPGEVKTVRSSPGCLGLCSVAGAGEPVEEPWVGAWPTIVSGFT